MKTAVIHVALSVLALAFPATDQAAGTDTDRLWFPVGEQLVFHLKWGVVPIGKSIVKSRWFERDGRKLIKISYRTYTNAFFDKVYPMNDWAQVLVDPDGFRPIRFTFSKARRRPICHDTVDFDYSNGKARVVAACSGWRNMVRISPEIRDIMSFMYLMRRQPHDRIAGTYRVMDNEGILDLKISAVRTEAVELPFFGSVDCVKVEPEIDLEGVLVEKSRVALWVSRDKRRVATRLEVKAPLANIHATLCCVTGPVDDRWTRVTKTKGLTRYQK